MLLKTYEFINDYEKELTHKRVNEPLNVPDREDNAWNDILNQLKAFVHEKNMSYPGNDHLGFYEDVPVLMAGAVNLVNFIIDSQNKTPIKTVVFLDKSARLGAHIFRVLWSTLEKQNKIPPNVTMPRIKFINVGKGENHKHYAKRSLDLAAEVFPREDLEGEGVLVIDEIVDSGGSLRRAMRSLDEKYGTKAQGMANFISLPEWYTQNEIKGVAEPGLSPEIYDYLEEADKDVFDFIKSIVNSNQPEKFVLEFLTDPIQMLFADFLEKYKYSNGISEDAKLLFDVHQELRFISSRVNPRDIIKYFKTFGGFTAMRPNRKSARFSFRYREYLTKMVELSADIIATKQEASKT